MIYDTIKEKSEYLEKIEQIKKMIEESDPVGLVVQYHSKNGNISTLHKVSVDGPIFQVIGAMDFAKRLLEKYIQ